LSSDSTTIAEIGKIKAFSVVPWGGINKLSDSAGVHGAATIILILKGEKKYKQIAISLIKYPDQKEWKVKSIK
jgi:hypothetical protein